MPVFIFLMLFFYSFSAFYIYSAPLDLLFPAKEAFLPTPMLPILIEASLFSLGFSLLTLLFNSVVTKATVKNTNARKGSHLSFGIQGLPEYQMYAMFEAILTVVILRVGVLIKKTI